MHARWAEKCEEGWTCVACGEPHKLVLCRGPRVRAHFRHDAACGGEGDRHRIAKLVAAQFFRSMVFRSECVDCGGPVESAAGAAFGSEAREAVVEDGGAIAPYRLDVGIRDRQGALVGAIEICDTHPVPPEKASALDAVLGHAWFEVSAQSVLEGDGSYAQCVRSTKTCGTCRPCVSCGRPLPTWVHAEYAGLCMQCDNIAYCFARKWNSIKPTDTIHFFKDLCSQPAYISSHHKVEPVRRLATEQFIRDNTPLDPHDVDNILSCACFLPREACSDQRVASILQRAHDIDSFLRSLSHVPHDHSRPSRLAALFLSAPPGVDQLVADSISAIRDSESFCFFQKWEHDVHTHPRAFLDDCDMQPPHILSSRCIQPLLSLALSSLPLPAPARQESSSGAII